MASRYSRNSGFEGAGECDPGLQIPFSKVLLTGASEGGLITAKSVEADSSYVGGLAVCGPIGSFQQQINYLGDARVFSTTSSLESWVMDGPRTSLRFPPSDARLDDEICAGDPERSDKNPLATLQFLSMSKIPIGLNLANAADAIVSALFYNVFATNDAIATLGGNPYGNIGRPIKDLQRCEAQ